MSSYQIIKRYKDSLYFKDCPVIIKAYALTKEIEFNRMLVQIKFKNIGNKVVKGVYVHVKGFESDGTLIEEIKDYAYLDIHANYNQEFGSKNALYLQNYKVRDIQIEIVKVIFEENYTLEVQPITLKPNFNQSLELYLGQSLSYEYKILNQKLNIQNLVVPIKLENFTQCICGSIYDGYQSCPICHKTFEQVNKEVNIQVLTESRNKRIELKKKKEEEKRLEKEKQREEHKKYFEEREKLKQKEKEEKKKKQEIFFKKNKKKMFMAGICVVFVVIFIILYQTIIHPYQVKENQYQRALKYYKENEYIEAYHSFDADYKDSQNYLDILTYKIYIKGKDCLNNQEYDDALNYFNEILEYKDTNTLYDKTEKLVKNQRDYEKGIEYWNDSNFSNSILYFNRSDSFKDAQTYLDSYQNFYNKYKDYIGNYDSSSYEEEFEIKIKSVQGTTLKLVLEINGKDYDCSSDSELNFKVEDIIYIFKVKDNVIVCSRNNHEIEFEKEGNGNFIEIRKQEEQQDEQSSSGSYTISGHFYKNDQFYSNE